MTGTVNFAIVADRLESRGNEKARQARPATGSQVRHATARGSAFVPDGVVGCGCDSDGALVFIAARARDRRGTQTRKTAWTCEAGRACARDRSSTLRGCFDVQADLLEARGGAASLSAAQRNRHTHHLWRTQ